MLRTSFFSYRQYRDVKAACILNAAAVLAYVIYQPEVHHYGGTWLGYTLGSIGFLMILALLAYGISKRLLALTPQSRKDRDYAETSLSQEQLKRSANQAVTQQATRHGWLSAHVCFGSSLLVIVTLHTGFNFGWNVQTLAYVLMCLVVLTGLYGIYAYLRLPTLLTKNLAGASFQSLTEQFLSQYDKAVLLASQLSPTFLAVITQAKTNTLLGGSVLQQLFPQRYPCATVQAIESLQAMSPQIEMHQAHQYRNLYTLMLDNARLLSRLRADIALRARLQIWLYLHVPLAILLLVSLIAHLLLVFFYW